MESLYNRSKYVAPYDYLLNCYILEYDIAKANISVLREFNVLTDKQYQYYYNLPKHSREISLGYLLRDNPEFVGTLYDGIKSAVWGFFVKNHIEKENVLYIDNDSVTIIYPRNSDLSMIEGKMGEFIEFKLKNVYTSFYRLNLIDLLYYNSTKFRFKNIDQNRLINKHKNYFMNLLLNICEMGQSNSIIDIVRMLKDTYRTYTSKKLEVDYYREFNSINKFKIINTDYSIFYTDVIDEINKDYIDIDYNASLLQLLYKIFMKEYFKLK